MNRLVMIVDLEVQAENAELFVAAARENAEQSVRLERGCHQFDVVRALDDKTKITFYEVFEDAEAFQAHAQTSHAAAFMAKAKSMVTKQAGRRGELAANAKK